MTIHQLQSYIAALEASLQACDNSNEWDQLYSDLLQARLELHISYGY